jgi:sugar lactone lactonase YvrE
LDKLTISCSRGTDDLTPQDKLTYQVWTSRSANIGTLAQVVANGIPFDTPKADLTTIDVTGLDDNVLYYANVVVADENGNKAAYQMTSALMPKHSRFYWVDVNASPPAVERADFSGAGVQNVVTSIALGSWGVAIDPEARKVYWTDGVNRKIMRAGFNGQNMEEVINQNLNTPRGIAVDHVNHVLYWTDEGTNSIYREAIPAGSPTDTDAAHFVLSTISGVDKPWGIDVDATYGKIYWAEIGTARRIRKADLDGNNANTIATLAATARPADVTVLPGSTSDSLSMVYFVDQYSGSRSVSSCTMGGSITALVTSNLNTPVGIDVDIASGTLFWSDMVVPGLYERIPGSTSADANSYKLSTPALYPRGLEVY